MSVNISEMFANFTKYKKQIKICAPKIVAHPHLF